MTSFDVVYRCKKILREMGVAKPKIGHGGTLDPFAEGVLLILIGRGATKRMKELSNLPKTYVATAKLGASSDTLDCTGEISPSSSSYRSIKLQDEINAIIPKFSGEIEQAVPDYSAAKVNGKPRYAYAREGKEVPAKAKKVIIHELKVGEISETSVVLTTTVSSGTYIRQLSYDLLKSVGVESYLTKLVRTQIGEITTVDCASLDALSAQNLPDKLLAL
jgi:tRNA pseudouridine55 synthase